MRGQRGLECELVAHRQHDTGADRASNIVVRAVRLAATVSDRRLGGVLSGRSRRKLGPDQATRLRAANDLLPSHGGKFAVEQAGQQIAAPLVA